MNRRNCLLISAMAVPLLWAEGPGEWRWASPDYLVRFPEDHWARAEFRTEWWYFTGHLRSIDHSEVGFGYQFTFFRIGAAHPRPSLDSEWASGSLIMGHAAISDFSTENHYFTEVFYREASFLGGFPGYPDPLIAWSLAPAGTDGKWTLRWNGSAFDFSMKDDHLQIGLDLTTQPAKPPVLQGPGGYSLKSRDGGSASQYYSFSRLATKGSLKVAGKTFEVMGSSWMDKEFSSSMLGKQQVGWDWMSLQLTDGRDVMLYRLRNQSGETDFASGTLISPAGDVQYLSQEQWALRPLDWWFSADSNTRYPVRWLVEVPDASLRLEVVSRFAGQENRSELVPGLNYWEGAVRILDEGGEEVGQGYVELVGYSKGRLPL